MDYVKKTTVLKELSGKNRFHVSKKFKDTIDQCNDAVNEIIKNRLKAGIANIVKEMAEEMENVNTIEFEHEGYDVEALTRTNHKYSPGADMIPESWDTEVEILELKIVKSE